MFYLKQAFHKLTHYLSQLKKWVKAMPCIRKVKMELAYYGLTNLSDAEKELIKFNCSAGIDYLTVVWMVRHKRSMSAIKTKLTSLGIVMDDLTEEEMRWISNRISQGNESIDTIVNGFLLYQSLHNEPGNK